MKQLAIAIAGLALLGGCATHYTTPGGGVSLAAISDSNIAEAFARQPAITFPARLAVARVAGSGYRSMTNYGYGGGAYTVVTTRDIETDEAFAKIAGMPLVSAVAPITRLLLPANLESTRELRNAAAQLRADALLIYTIDTRFRTETDQIGPLQTVALGMFATHKAIVTSTCAFAIVDVRTGFLYGTGETTATEDKRSNIWGTEEAADRARQLAETQAFEEAVGEVRRLWSDIVREHS